MKYKQNDKRRTRSIDLGIKVSEEEKQDLLNICKHLGITKIEFLTRCIKEYKEA